MAGIKNKIKDMMHKDKTESPTHGSTMGHHSTTGASTGTTSHHESAGTRAKESLGGYDATTSTGGRSGYNEEGARTGMSDLDINRSSNTGGGTTGLREGHHGTGHTTSAGGVGGSSLGTTRTTDSTTGEIIDAERFTKTEDHEVVIEKKAYELEHRPVQKKYVVETKYEGERAVAGGPTELLGTEAREVEERVVEMPHGDREVIVENVDIPVEGVLPGHKINLPSSEGVFPAGSRSDKVEALAGQHGHHHHTHGTGSDMGGNTGMGSGTGMGSSSRGNEGLGMGGQGTGTGMGSSSRGNEGLGMTGGQGTGTGMGSNSRGNEGLGMTGGQGTGTNPGTGLSGSNTGSGRGTSGRGTGL